MDVLLPSRWRGAAAIFLIIAEIVVCQALIPTTLDGPFKPSTRSFDPSLRRGSADLPMDHPRLKKNVSGNFPQQIALALSSSPTSMWVSWVTGDAQIGSNVIPLDPASVGSEVWYGKESGKYTDKVRGNSSVYSQLYPFEGLSNYTSGIIHHVRIDGLEPGTKYFYKCGDSSMPAMSDELVLQTMPLPGSNSYPARIAVIGDLGLTSNSSSTIDHLTMNDPSLILMVGDLTYANQYLTTGGKGASCYSCAFPDAPIRETYQPRWDGWGRFMEPLTSRIPMMVIEGNHEIEPQVAGITFKSYLTRFAVPSEESGSNSNFYYSFEAGGIHFIMLGAYVDYNSTGAQYTWLQRDLNQVNRSNTPWLVAAWHPPWYNSYNSHYQEFECMRQEMEALLYQYGVDIVFNGHVHAYERINRVYNYTLDSCGPVYITVGDGGNSLAKGKFCWDSQPEWSAFRESSFGHGILEVPHILLSLDLQLKTYLIGFVFSECHEFPQVVNSTYALWKWHRNQDNYKDDKLGDRIYIVRQPELCTNSSTSKVILSSSTVHKGKEWQFLDAVHKQ
ncbi:unnamed protein product [Linum tenue]|uniref:Purple acid phosphatase n=1 Tax=Linum tenue TaxID=586396 RepID=A0AAV0H510_9ROSI|nr:unnamed protein product [Linum tenue]